MTNTPRLDLLIAQHGRTIVIALCVIAALSVLAAGWAVANPASTTTTETVGEETVETEVQTSATVVEDGLWEEGEVLRNNPAYVTAATPELEVILVTAADGSETEVESEVTLRYEATREGEVFWSDTEELASETDTVGEDATSVEATVDVREVREQRDAITEQLEGISEVELRLEIETAYETETHQGTLEAETPFVITEGSHYLEEHPSASESHAVTQTVEETEPPSSTALGLLILLAGGAIAGAAFVHSRSDIDVEHARQAVHENRYAEWISHGSLPMWMGEEHVSLDTLEDVVDVAIDTNERVIHDRTRGLFAVVSDNVVYYYSDRGLWEETAWPDFDLQKRPPDAEVQDPPSVPDRVDSEGPDTEDLEAVDTEDLDDDDAWRNL